MSSDNIQGGSPTSAQKEATRIVVMYMNIRLEICTKIDSVFNIISDYPTLKTCKELAIIHVKGLIAENELFPSRQITLESVLSEIEKM